MEYFCIKNEILFKIFMEELIAVKEEPIIYT